MKTVKLKSINIANYKNIGKLSEDVNGNHFIVFGKNGQGKTSLMEVINRSALRIEPKDMADIPIKLGAKNSQTGIVYLIEDDGKKTEILVETIHRPSGSVMKVVDLSNNGELKPPVERLQQLIGESHDVSQLGDLDGKEQFKFLLKILGGNTSAENFEAAYKNKYAERAVLNKQIKTAEANIKLIEPDANVMLDYRSKGLYAEKKEEPKQPDKGGLLVRQAEAKAYNEKVERAQKAREEIAAEIEKLQKRLQDADAWLAENKAIDMADIEAELVVFDEKLVSYKDEVLAVRKHNNIVDSIITYNAKKKELEEIEKNRDAVQKEMDDLSKQMKDSVSSLKIEALVPELTLLNEVDDDGNVKQGLYYKTESGLLPFNRRQISYGKVLVALVKLSSFVNAGKLNIFHVPAWESLDDDSRAEILSFAEQNEDLNIQFCIEEVKQELLGLRLIEKKNKEDLSDKE